MMACSSSQQSRIIALRHPIVFFGCNLLLLVVFALSFTIAQPPSSASVIDQFMWKYENHTNAIKCQGNASLSPANEMCLSPSALSFPLTSGRCIYDSPVHLSTAYGLKPSSRSFSTMFSFTTLKYPSTDPGQGFTFFMGPDNTSAGDSGYYLGWLNSTTEGDSSGHNFAVEFDITANSEVNDMDDNHVGINVNSLKSRSVSSLRPIGIDLASFDAQRKLYAWIDYDGAAIDVRVGLENRKPCNSIISVPLDLADVLLDSMYVGFSSSTGDDTNTQTTMIDWSFSTNGTAKNIYGEDAYCGSDKKKLSWIVVFAVVIGILFVALVMFVLLLHYRSRKIEALEKNIEELQYLDNGAHEFTYNELLLATKKFSPKEILGQGASGTVYKGTLSSDRIRKLKGEDASKDNSVVAVKRINKKSADGVKEYVAEVKVIGRFRHVNLVRVLGWCHQRGELLLVYEYMPNGNLYDFMFKGPSTPGGRPVSSPNWTTRLEILRGVAGALVFLHEECEQRVVHRDVKSSNVMLDSDFHARLGDFGLARSHDKNDVYHSTFVAGTIGYLAPECFVTGYATTKSDVYSFGVLALEIATGRKPTEGKEGLAKWVWELQSEGRVMEAVDAYLDGKYNKHEMEKLLKVAIFCCLPDPESRPSMRQVQTVLQGESSILSLPVPPPPKRGMAAGFPPDGFDAFTTVDMSEGSTFGAEESFLAQIGRSHDLER